MTGKVAATIREAAALTRITITKRVYESLPEGFRVSTLQQFSNSAIQLVSLSAYCFRSLLIALGRTGASGLVNDFAHCFRRRGQGVRSTFFGSLSSAERYAARTTSRVRRPSSPLAPDGSPSATPRRKSASIRAFMSSPVYDHDGAPVSWSKVRKGRAKGSTSRTPEVPAILSVTSPQVG